MTCPVRSHSRSSWFRNLPGYVPEEGTISLDISVPDAMDLTLLLLRSDSEEDLPAEIAQQITELLSQAPLQHAQSRTYKLGIRLGRLKAAYLMQRLSEHDTGNRMQGVCEQIRRAHSALGVE